MNPLRQYIDILYEAEYDTRIAKLTQLYPDHKADFDWAKTNLVRKDRIYWYLKQVEDLIKNNKPQDIKPLQDNLFHYIGQTNIQGIQNYPFNINQTTQDLFNQLQQIEQKYNANTRPAALTTPNDVDLIKYPDGTRWVQLDRAYCEKEGVSGKHCGNVVGKYKPDQRILSYRDNRDRVILTFILEPDGTLGEMKGVSNNKPDSRYHKQILNLLMLPAIKGIISGGYAPDQNFSIFDLDENYLKYVQDNKPSLIVDQLKATPIEILRAPDFIKKNINYTDVVKQKLPDIGNLIDNPSLDNWENVIENDASLIIYAPDELNNYEERLLKFLSDYFVPRSLLKVRKKYRTNYDFLFKLLNQKPRYIVAIPENTNRYKELQLLALSKSGILLENFPEDKRDYEMCLTAVKNNGHALGYVPKEVQLKYPNISLEAVKKDGRALQYVPRELQLKYPNISLEAVKKDGSVLQFVPRELLLKDPNISLEAVKNHGSVLQFVPEELLLKDPNISLEAVKNHGWALYYVPEELKLNHPNISLEAVKNYGDALGYVPKELLLKDTNISLEAVKKGGTALRFVPEELLLKDQNISLEAVKKDGDALGYVPKEVQLKYPNISLEAVKKDGSALGYVPTELLLKHPNIPLEAVKKDGLALEYVPNKVQLKHPNIPLEAVKNDFNALGYVPNEIKVEILQKLKTEKDDNDELKEFKNILNKLIIKT